MQFFLLFFFFLIAFIQNKNLGWRFDIGISLLLVFYKIHNYRLFQKPVNRHFSEKVFSDPYLSLIANGEEKHKKKESAIHFCILTINRYLGKEL